MTSSKTIKPKLRACGIERSYALAFVALLSAYFSYNLLFRWLRYVLFSAHGCYGWERAGLPETMCQFFVTLFPLGLWASCIFLVGSRFSRRATSIGVAILGIAALITIELDMRWYAMSKQHATFADGRVFLTENWHDHFGIRTADITRFGIVVIGHTTLVMLFAVLAIPVSRLRSVAAAGSWMTLRRTAGTVLVLGLLDGVLVAAFKSRAYDLDRSQWQSITCANPLRPPLIDTLFYPLTSSIFRDTEAANAALENLLAHPPAAIPERPPLITLPGGQSSHAYKVLVIGVESLNPQYVDATSMPFYSRIAEESIVLAHHYSTGNATHLGVLGLLFGAPPYFYQGATTEDTSASAYLDAFSRRGYRTRMLGTDLSAARYMGYYLRNFSQPTEETEDTSDLLTLFQSEWDVSGPKFTFLFYFPTHFPYRHSDAYRIFLPEAAENSDYLVGSNIDDVQHIRNRYRNCLREADAWLEQVLEGVNLDETILVITGDHGQEFFEYGRLGHSSYLDEPQMRTACIVRVPHCGHHAVDSVTSHSDLMPSIADALGWENAVESFGQSIFRQSPPRSAVVARNEQMNPVQKWAVITADRKSIVTFPDHLRLQPQIVDLFDLRESRVTFLASPEIWTENFDAVVGFRNYLIQKRR